jgi:membrane associated rhomboid family serine protease
MLIPYKNDMPRRIVPLITVALVAINTAIFLYFRLVVAPAPVEFQAAVKYMGLIPARFFLSHARELKHVVALPAPLTLISAMFMHGSFLHLGGNMLYLWIFGVNIEDYFGHIRFLIFYLVVGIIGSVAFMITQPFSSTPMVGASGAIAGVLGAYFLLYPRSHVRVLLFLFFFITTLEVPAILILGVWILIQILEGMTSVGSASGVAWFAHIGGFFAGIALVGMFARRRKRRT